MRLVNILVHVDLDEPAAARLTIARGLAETHGAGLTGVAVCAPPPSTVAHGGFAVAVTLLEGERKRGEAHLADAQAVFRAAAAGLTGPVAWREGIAPPAGYVALQGRNADLVVVGALREGIAKSSLHALDPAELVLRAGRPLLVVPPAAREVPGRRIVVAWKDTREARRAAADALPLLARAERTVVVEVLEPGDEGEAGGAAGVAVWLRSHGIAAEGLALPVADSVAETLNRTAAELGADLIVAGAYGHGRLREWVLGGVTADLLAASPHCLLLSH